MTKITLTLLFTLTALSAAEKHPWASFKPGSYAKLRTTTSAGPSNTVTEMTQTLISIDGNNAVVEVETKMMGQSSKTRTNIPLKSTATGNTAAANAPKASSETIAVAGKSLACTCYDSESNANGMKMTTRACTSDSVPGATVKAVSKSAGAMKMESVTELVEFAAK
jgi:hypothetical protein